MTSQTKPAARAEASRRNGAKSRGPVTAAGRASSARNALKHGLRARTAVLLDDEDAAAFFATALRAELQPDGALQTDLVARLALAAWRARRADRIEAALFARYLDAGAGGVGCDFGAALIRDGNGPRAIETLLRYRGSVLAELFRALGALKALQAEARAQAEPGTATLLPPPACATKRTRDPQKSWASAAAATAAAAALQQRSPAFSGAAVLRSADWMRSTSRIRRDRCAAVGDHHRKPRGFRPVGAAAVIALSHPPARRAGGASMPPAAGRALP